METICKENTNTISFLKNVIKEPIKYTNTISFLKNVIKEPIKSPLSLVSHMF